MEQTIFNWLLDIPQTLAQFGSWLTTPLGNGIDISPLGLFGISGVAIIIFIIAVHIVRLFI